MQPGIMPDNAADGPDSPLIYLVAGEASGDVLGARLIAALRAARPGSRFAGVAGPRMTAEGMDSLFPMSDLAVMGLVEILPRFRLLRRRMLSVVADIAARGPDVVVTVDSPGFGLHVLRRVAPLGIPRVQYVAPQVWAWREHRVRRFPGLWEEFLCLLPFEDPAYFARPRPGRRGSSGTPRAAIRRRHRRRGPLPRAARGIPPDAPVLILMPGSRRSEAPRLLPVFGQMLALLASAACRTSCPSVPAAHAVAEPGAGGEPASGWPVRPVIVTEVEDKHDAYAAAAAALTKSGTSTLELALAGVPMAVTYRVNAASAVMARRMIRVPLCGDGKPARRSRALVPELLQQRLQRRPRSCATVLDPVATIRKRRPRRSVPAFAGVVLASLRATMAASRAVMAAPRAVLGLLREGAAHRNSPATRPPPSAVWLASLPGVRRFKIHM